MIFYHIMPIEIFIHNETIIKLINDNPEKFNKDEHYFVVTSKEGYEKYKDTNNMIYDPRIALKNKHKVFKEYINKSDFVFLHSNDLRFYELLFLKKKHLNKVIWGVWGHDLYTVENMEKVNIYHKFRSILKKCVINKIRKYKTKQFYALGIGFKYDALEIRKKYGDVRILPLLYGYNNELLKNVNNLLSSKVNKDDAVKIMIGHSGYPFLQHLKILDILSKYKDENIIISLPLSYGNKEYSEKVKNYAKNIFGKKVEILENTMTFEEYFKYIMSVDISILDFKHQSALGNLWLLLKTGTKIFLNSDGIIKLSMLFEMIETYDVEEISQMSFDEFSKKLSEPRNGIEFSDLYLDEQTAVKMFEYTLLQLKKK